MSRNMLNVDALVGIGLDLPTWSVFVDSLVQTIDGTVRRAGLDRRLPSGDRCRIALTTTETGKCRYTRYRLDYILGGRLCYRLLSTVHYWSENDGECDLHAPIKRTSSIWRGINRPCRSRRYWGQSDLQIKCSLVGLMLTGDGNRPLL